MNPFSYLTGHVVFIAGVILMGAGAVLLPTNVQKLATTTIGFFLAAAGARDVLHSFAWSWNLVPIVAFLGVTILSTLLSKARKPTIVLPSVMRSDGLLTQALYVALTLFASQLVLVDREIVMRALIWGAGFVTVVAYWQSLGHAQWALPAGATPAMLDTKIRACGTLANPLFLGGYCALLLPIVAVRAVQWGHAEDMVAALLLTYTAILSGSRAAWLGILVAFPFVFLHSPPHWRELVLGMAVVVTVVVFGRREHLSRAGWKDVIHDTIKSTVSGRRYIWRECWNQIKQRPLFGHGYNVMSVRNPDPAANDFFDRSHMEWLDTAHAVGLVGLACYVGVLAVAFMHAGMFLPGLVAYVVWVSGAWNHLGPAGVAWTVIGLSVAGTG